MRKICVALMLTVCMGTAAVPVWAEEEIKTEQNNAVADWDGFVNTVNEAFTDDWNEMKNAVKDLEASEKTADNLAEFMEVLKTSTNTEYEALKEYQEQSVGEEGSNQKFIQDSYMDSIKVLWEASQNVTEEDLADHESEFWANWKKGRNERYDVIMELFYYLDDTELDENMVQEIHDKYYEDMILKDDTESMKRLQNGLGAPADGFIGPGTLGELKKWQKDNKKEVRGIITEELLDEIDGTE